MNIDMIKAAAKRLDGNVRRTPLLESDALNRIAERRVLVKAECLQTTGSFKARGSWAAVSALPEAERVKGIIAFSSGNHAQGVARAAAAHGVPSVIIMPADAPQAKINNTRTLGAEVILYDRAHEDRDAIGARLAKERGLVLIKPFDNADVIAGQGTTGLEIAEQAAEFGVTDADVLVCCGGGGLTSGIAVALADAAPDMVVHPVEPDGFDDVTRSLASGQIERNARLAGSLCDAIITPQPGDMTFPLLQKYCGPGVVVSEEDAQRAMVAAYTHLRLVAEPGGAVALAAALYHAHHLNKDTLIATISGGNVDPTLFADTLQKFG